MKKSSKNNYSEKNSKKYKKNSKFSFNSKDVNSSKKNDKFTKYSDKSFKSLNEIDKNKRNFSSKNSESINKSHNKFSNKGSDIHHEYANKKNFNDWIWGKHSVFETLNSERAINRIWCTTEIYSSEKFFLLLKELKSKGVLIEEVSWNRLSQLTLGASHQGIA